MTRYVLSEYAVEWLKENRFSDEEIDQLQEILNWMVSKHNHSKGEQPLKFPKGTTASVSTLVRLLDSITDAEGRPICFEESGLIQIPDEAKQHFEEDLELEELEGVTSKLKKVKFARRYSDPRRRGTMKGDDKFKSL
ncbi:MAG: hypothetical protein AB1324_05155 [Candidatus Micrarchaeota archaeon]